MTPRPMAGVTALLAALVPLPAPAPAPDTARMRFHAFVVAEFSPARGRSVYYISQDFLYCEGPGTNNHRSLERQAVVEVEQLASQGQINRPAAAKLRVYIDGAHATEAESERGRQWYLKKGARTYRTGFDAIYYPARMCDW